MPKQNTHDEIVSILLELCRSYKVYKKSYRGGKQHRLVFATPTHGKPISRQYEPDVIAEWRRGRYKDVFEVWHSESEDAAVLDILYPALHRAQNKEIRYLCIVCTGSNLGEEQANDLKNLILDNLRGKEGNELFPRDEILVTEIPKDIQQDRLKMKEYLFQKLDFSP
jgi:hypothetical protein